MRLLFIYVVMVSPTLNLQTNVLQISKTLGGHAWDPNFYKDLLVIALIWYYSSRAKTDSIGLVYFVVQL